MRWFCDEVGNGRGLCREERALTALLPSTAQQSSGLGAVRRAVRAGVWGEPHHLRADASAVWAMTTEQPR